MVEVEGSGRSEKEQASLAKMSCQLHLGVMLRNPVFEVRLRYNVVEWPEHPV